MSYRIDLIYDAIEVRIRGWDALALLRFGLAIPYTEIIVADVVARRDVEQAIHGKRRAIGPPVPGFGVKRLGTFVSGAEDRQEFWAVRESEPDEPLVVVEWSGDPWSRAVLMPERLDEFVRVLQQQLKR